MPGIIGIYAFDEKWSMARFTYYGLLALQHRGQETCGIVTYDGKGLHRFASEGFVDQAITPEIIEKLPGWIGIGHVGTKKFPEEQVEPVLIKEPKELAICFNGKILKLDGKEVKEPDAIALGKALSEELSKTSDPLEAVEELDKRLYGVYCYVALDKEGNMLVARDKTGMKPFVIGSFGFDYGVVASESCAIDVIGADYKMDIEPGEAYLFTPYSIEKRRFAKPCPKYCAFEYVYLARPDSIINGKSIYEVRMRIGEILAEEGKVDADIVLGVPATAIPFAMAYANKTKIPIGMGFVATGRAVRSAIKPTQFERLMGVQLKLNPIRSAMSGKRIVLIDDSVVRGTTTKNTVNLMRNRIGVKEVHVRIGSPRLIGRCPYGFEVPPEDELIAAHLTEEEVSKVVGADTFKWLSLEGLVKAIGIPKENLCLGCFTREYPL